MASALPFFGRQKVKISKSLTEFVELDASVNETHSWSATVTEHPVEAGENISDHVRVNAVKLKISGVISNTPLTLTQINLNPIRAEQAVTQLKQWLQDGEQLTVRTAVDDYEPMLLVSITQQRDKEKANAAFLDLDFTRLTLAESDFATVDPTSSTTATKKPKSRGKVATKIVTPNRSLALKGIKALTGL